MTNAPQKQSNLDVRVKFHLHHLETHDKPHHAFFEDVAQVSCDEIASIESAHFRLQLAIAAIRLCNDNTEFAPIKDLIYQVFDRVEECILQHSGHDGNA